MKTFTQDDALDWVTDFSNRLGCTAPEAYTMKLGMLANELHRLVTMAASEQAKQIRTALKEACDEYEYAYPYKGDFLAAKHCDAERVAKLRAVLAAERQSDGRPEKA